MGPQIAPREAVQDREDMGCCWRGDSERLVLSEGSLGQAGLGLPLEEGSLENSSFMRLCRAGEGISSSHLGFPPPLWPWES